MAFLASSCLFIHQSVNPYLFIHSLFYQNGIIICRLYYRYQHQPKTSDVKLIPDIYIIHMYPCRLSLLVWQQNGVFFCFFLNLLHQPSVCWQAGFVYMHLCVYIVFMVDSLHNMIFCDYWKMNSEINIYTKMEWCFIVNEVGNI